MNSPSTPQGSLRKRLNFALLALPLLATGCGWVGIAGGAAIVATSGGGGGGGGGGSSTTAPTVSVAPSASQNRLLGDIPIDFTISDNESDPATAELQFSLAGGPFQLCTPAMTSPSTSNLTTSPAGTPHSFIWAAANDLNVNETRAVVVKVSVRQDGQMSARNEDSSAAFRIGNLAPQLSTITFSPPGVVRGSVVVGFTLADTLGDEAGISRYEYSTNNGATWSNITAIDGGLKQGIKVGTSSGPTTIDFTWNTRNEPGIGSGVFDQIMVRLTPVDTFLSQNFEGQPQTSLGGFAVDNNTRAFSTVLLDGASDTVSPLGIPFVIQDEDADMVQVLLQWRDVNGDDFPDLNDPFLNKFVDPTSQDFVGPSIANPLVRSAVLADSDTRKKLQIITELASQTFDANVAVGSTSAFLKLPDLVGKVIPESLLGARVSFQGAEVATITTFVNGIAVITPFPPNQVPPTPAPPPGSAISIKVPLVTQNTLFRGSSAGELYNIIWDANKDFFGPVTAQVRSTPFDLRQGVSNFSRRTDFTVEGQLRVLTGTVPPVGNRPFALLQTDFDGDGDNDIITTAFGRVGATNVGTVTVLINERGRFVAAPPSQRAGTEPSSLAVGDFSDDGFQDLVIANRADGKLRILFQKDPNSLGSADENRFLPETTAPAFIFDLELGFAESQKPIALAVADFDANGLLDIAVAIQVSSSSTTPTSIDRIRVFYQMVNPQPLNVFDRLFIEGPSLNCNTMPSGLRVADLNQDGTPDVIVCSFGAFNNITLQKDSLVEVFFSVPPMMTSTATSSTVPAPAVIGPGSFPGPSPISETGLALMVAEGPQDLELKDINGDGVPELFVLSEDFGIVQVFSFDKFTNTFSVAANDLSTDFGPRYIDVDDVNGDGILDIVTSNQAADSISIFLGLEDGSFAEAPGSPIPAAGGVRQIIAGEIFPGAPGIAIAAFQDDAVFIATLGKTTTLQEAFGIVDAPPEPRGFLLFDADNNGFLEALFTSEFDNSLRLFSQDLLGRFNPVPFGPNNSNAVAAGDFPGPIVGGDLNGDGAMDFGYLGESNNDFDGDGVNDEVLKLVFQETAATGPITSALEIFVPPATIMMKSADLNSDGIADIAALSLATFSISIIAGNNSLSSIAIIDTLTFNELPNSMDLGDLNGDGRTDVLVGFLDPVQGPAVRIFVQQAGGGFAELVDAQGKPTPIIVPGIVMAVAIGDIDRDLDRLPDIAVLSNVGDETDGTPGNYVTVFVQTRFGDYVTVRPNTIPLRNDPTNILIGQSLGFAVLNMSSAVLNMSIGDLDSDGKPDIVAQVSENELRILFHEPSSKPGSFLRLSETQGSFFTAFDIRKITLRDINRDGADDLVVFSTEDPGITIFLQR